MSAATASILVVDDAETGRNLPAEVLGRRGYKVTTAEDGRQALDAIATQAPDLMLLDTRMPEMDGLAALRALRERYSKTELPVIMVSVEAEGGAIAEAFARGANDYVTKPIDFQILLARIQSQLAHKRAEEALRGAQEELSGLVEQQTAKLRQTVSALEHEAAKHKHTATVLRSIYDDTPAMFFTLAPDGTIRSINRYGADKLGYEVDELVGQPYTMLLYERDRAMAEAQLAACLARGDGERRWQIRKRRKTQGRLWLKASARRVDDPSGAPTVLIVCEDISEAHYLSEQLAHQASHDELTGLINRRELERRLQRNLQSTRSHGRAHALIYLDLDQFKIVNDTCGHAAGDTLLRELGAVLAKQLRTRDTLARIGGDKFAVLLDHCALPDARRVGRMLKAAIADFDFAWAGKRFRLESSLALVPITVDSKSVTSVMSAADASLDAAKEGGRNRIHEYHLGDTTIRKRHGELQRVVQINEALATGRFQLCQQPIAPLGTGGEQGECYEILLRMLDAEGGLVRPGEFLAAAERFNLSSKLDRWVIRAVLEWLAAHPETLERLGLCFINLSAQSLVDEALAPWIMEQLAASRVPAKRICFEITETAAIANLPQALQIIRVLQGQGCRFALDDFGSGLSSFAYLKNLPVDFLKIDGIFVRDILEDPMDLEMVKSINGIGHVMGKRTIAEFVESPAILERLRGVGVDYVQGYAIAEPRPMEELTAPDSGLEPDLMRAHG